MNRILPAILFYLITWTSLAQTNWELLNPTPSYQTGQDIHFVSDTKGFIITAEELLVTQDAGDTWSKKVQLSGAEDIHFLGNTGYIAGQNGYVLVSRDGGDSWTSVNTGTSENFNSVQILDEKTIILSGSKAVVRSDDGGETWESYAAGGSYTINKTFFTGALTGHAVCRGGSILKTVDGGQSWYVTESTNTIPNSFFTVYFVNEKLGFATREHDEILKTTDGGETWQDIDGIPDALFTFFFLDEETGFAAGEHGSVFKTEDGGDTWKWTSFQNGRYMYTSIYSMYFTDDQKGFLVGHRGMIHKTTDGGSTWEGYSPFYKDVDQLQVLEDGLVGYASVASTLYKTEDAGKSWQNMGGPWEGGGINKFKFLDENTGYATVGTSQHVYSVYKTTDGGKSWVKTNGGRDILRDNLYSLEFINEEVGFVSGGFNQKGVFKTTNGGDNWIIVETLSFGEMQFPDEETGYAREVGYSVNKVYKTTDAGENWEVIFELENQLKTIYFVDKEVGFVAGERGEMYKTTDGGGSWTKLDVPNLEYLHLRFYSANVGYAMTTAGILKTENGGFSWHMLPAIPPSKAIDITNDKQIFISGASGRILKSSISFESYHLSIGPAEEILSDRAALTGNASSNTEGITDLQFEYGTNNKFDKVLSVTPHTVAPNESSTFSVTAEELLPQTRYQYRLKGTVDGKTVYSRIKQFTTMAEYELRLNHPTLDNSNVAKVSGVVISHKSGISGIEFQYGTKEDPFSGSISASPASVSANNTSAVEATLPELEYDTEYRFRIKAVHEGTVIYSNVGEFNTFPTFEVMLFPAEVGDNYVTYSANLTAYEEDITDLVFEYGSREFEHEIAAEQAEVKKGTTGWLTATVEDLNPSQTYFFRVKGRMADENIHSYTGVFNTSRESVMVPLEAKINEDRSVTLKGLINPGKELLTQIHFEYGLDGRYNMSVPTTPTYLTGSGNRLVTADLKDLVPGSTYSFRVKARVKQEDKFSEGSSFQTAEAIQIGQDVISIQVSGETCDGKNNGSLLIEAQEEHDFMAVINGEEYYFSTKLKLEDLGPGTYTGCITAASAPDFSQCFEVKVGAGKTMAGKAQVQKNALGYAAHINIKEGTAPFRVSLNGKLVGNYDSSEFLVDVHQGDQLEVTSKAACEGKFTLDIDLKGLTAFPNPASSILNIQLPLSEKKAVQVAVYNNSGSLMFSGEYNIINNVVSLPLDKLISGIYFAVVRLDTPQTVKFSKK